MRKGQRIKIGDKVFRSYAEASASLGKSRNYITSRMKKFNAKLPDGTAIDIIEGELEQTKFLKLDETVVVFVQKLSEQEKLTYSEALEKLIEIGSPCFASVYNRDRYLP